MPDFDSVVVREQESPYSDTALRIFEYSDPQLRGYSATVVADTQPDFNDRLVTQLVNFPRPVLAEMNTHRVFSRNSASSRARSVRSTLKTVIENPYVPLLTANMKGMSGPFIEGPERERLVEEIHAGRDEAVRFVLRLLLGSFYKPEYTVDEACDVYYDEIYTAENSIVSPHKQVVNRYLEPFMFHEAVITSGYWSNFDKLRGDLATADPAIYAIARLMEEARVDSTPDDSSLHVPFIPKSTRDSLAETSLKELLLGAASEAARLSYSDRSKITEAPTGGLKLAERLIQAGHWSPFEHLAVYRMKSRVALDVFGKDPQKIHAPNRNFPGPWVQLRALLDD